MLNRKNEPPTGKRTLRTYVRMFSTHIKTVQENLGHATASFTLATYAHATLGMKRESAKRMDDFIRSVQEGGENHVPAAAS